MLPEVKQFMSLDADRDGGSIGVSFRDGAGDQVSLLLPRRSEVPGFGTPELQRFVTHQYTSKFDGDQLPYVTREDTPLSWEDAGVLLARIEPFLDSTEPAWIRHQLAHAVATRGDLLPQPLSPQTSEP